MIFDDGNDDTASAALDNGKRVTHPSLNGDWIQKEVDGTYTRRSGDGMFTAWTPSDKLSKDWSVHIPT